MMTKNTSLRRCIEDLSSKNTDYKYPEQAINQAESLKSLSSDLYTDDVRFIYELIQNADDAQTVHIILAILDNKYLIIGHDGQAFNEKDVEGLCGVNNETKEKDLDKTGYKGLGFKAVFGKSDYVIIYSNDEFFRFDSSCPIKWNKQWGTDDQQAWERENDRQFIYSWQINPIWTTANEIPSIIRSYLSSKIKQIHVANIILLKHVERSCIVIDQLKKTTIYVSFFTKYFSTNILYQSNRCCIH
ncbi:unnamed protein product [Rotaria sp. Silwood2]|nr:unnamed protein product [Rotaria sp. Silwood2]CAF4074463.1 unnamed protein product [Rotaria sp. Silwood2]